METSFIFIALIIVAITQVVKMFVPVVNGAITILVAIGVGIVVALLDKHIGLPDITIAAGITSALGGVGATVLASKAGGGAAGDGKTNYQH